MKKKVTVLMPAYNSDKYIANAIESVLSQAFIDFKFIIINDGSTDGTLELINHYASKDSRITVLNKENGGIGSARKLGLSLVETEYFSFVDSDDYIHANFLYDLYGLAKADGSDIVDCNYIKNLNGVDYEVKIENNCDVDIYLKNLLTHRQLGVLWNKLIKTEFVKKNGIDFYDGLNMWEDLYFCVKMLSCKPKISHVDSFLYKYIMRVDSLVMRSFNSQRVIDQVIISEMISEIPKLNDNYKKQINGCKIFSKEIYSTSEIFHDNKKWISIFPLSLIDIISSDIHLKIKLFALISHFDLTLVQRFIFKARCLYHNIK